MVDKGAPLEMCSWCNGAGTIWATYPEVKEHLCHGCRGSGKVEQKETQESLDSFETASAHFQDGIGLEDE